MPLIVESYQLRGLLHEWELSIPDGVCDDFQDYKGGFDCGRCDYGADLHERKRCVAQLRALVEKIQEQRWPVRDESEVA